MIAKNFHSLSIFSQSHSNWMCVDVGKVFMDLKHWNETLMSVSIKEWNMQIAMVHDYLYIELNLDRHCHSSLFLVD